jgi:hypothetical protein
MSDEYRVFSMYDCQRKLGHYMADRSRNRLFERIFFERIFKGLG